MNYSSERMLLSNQREGQISRFRAWAVVVVPLAAVLFQIEVPLLLPFLGFVEMPLLVVIYFALMRRSQVFGLLMGAAVGLAQDSLSKNYLGMFGIVNTMVGYFAASVGLRLDVDHPLMRLVFSFFFYQFHQFLYWLLSRVLLGTQVGFDWQRGIAVGLMNAVLATALFSFLDKFRENA